MNDELADFNKMVRDWADAMPEKYRLSAKAFGYRCNMRTHSFDGTLEWISKLSRRYGYGVSRPTLVRHLRVFRDHGVIAVERRRRDKMNTSSVYHVNFDRVISRQTPTMGADGRCNCVGCMQGTGCIWEDDAAPYTYGTGLW